jgi:DNA-binding transcriptional MerR regulator
MEKLLTIVELADASGIPVRSIRTLQRKGILGSIRTGHRSQWFRPSAVEKALKAFEVKSAK